MFRRHRGFVIRFEVIGIVDAGEYNARRERQKRVHNVCWYADRRRRAVFDWPVIIALSP
jgi:hypothetical protein